MRLRIACLTIAIVATGSLAQSALAAPTGAQSARDPNEKVCESQIQIGSRLGGKKVCATRAEWSARKAAERQSLDELQRTTAAMPCVRDNIGGGHVVSC